MADTYHIKIKKDYAVSVIEDLKKMDAVALLSDTDEFTIPEWQKELGREEIKNISDNPVLLNDWEKAKKEFKV